MRNLFALLGLLIIGIGCVGWYMGWYKVNVSKNTDGSLQIKTDVDTKKVEGDSSAFFQKVGQMVDEKTQSGSQNGTTPPTTTPANTPGNTPANPPTSNNPYVPNIPPPPMP